MSKKLRILVAQLNPVVGDIRGNLELARGALAEGKAKGADLVVLSELFILGYPAEDLVLKPAAVEDSMKAVNTLAAETADAPDMIIGAPWMEDGKRHNSAVWLSGGAIKGRYDKRELPNYGVFDEKRIFDAGDGPPPVFEFHGVKIGVAICEDIWYPRVPSELHDAGADMLIVPNGSPWRWSGTRPFPPGARRACRTCS